MANEVLLQSAGICILKEKWENMKLVLNALQLLTGTVSAAREGCKLFTGMGRDCSDSLELDEGHDKGFFYR